MRRSDHLLHIRPDSYGVEWRLECLTDVGEHFTADLDEWGESADELEARGVQVDRSTCWVHAYLENAGHHEDWLAGDNWPEDGPWPVCCSFDGSLTVEYVPPAEGTHSDRGGEG